MSHSIHPNQLSAMLAEHNIHQENPASKRLNHALRFLRRD